MNMEKFEKVDLTYDQVRLFRKRWFLFLTFLFFIPATIVIALTGDIYLEKDSSVYKFGDAQRNMVVMASVVFIVINVIRLNM